MQVCNPSSNPKLQYQGATQIALAQKGQYGHDTALNKSCVRETGTESKGLCSCKATAPNGLASVHFIAGSMQTDLKPSRNPTPSSTLIQSYLGMRDSASQRALWQPSQTRTIISTCPSLLAPWMLPKLAACAAPRCLTCDVRAALRCQARAVHSPLHPLG